jgi:hypothetical protein
LLSVFGLALKSGTPHPTQVGVCKTSEGEVDTYNIIGVWKKDTVSNAHKSRSEDRFLYIIQSGAESVIESDDEIAWPVLYNSAICEKIVSSEGEEKVTKVGLYFHDESKGLFQSSVMNLEAEEGEMSDDVVKYSFSGSCEGTKLILTRGNRVEAYTLVTTNPATNACSFAE